MPRWVGRPEFVPGVLVEEVAVHALEGRGDALDGHEIPAGGELVGEVEEKPAGRGVGVVEDVPERHH